MKMLEMFILKLSSVLLKKNCVNKTFYFKIMEYLLHITRFGCYLRLPEILHENLSAADEIWN